MHPREAWLRDRSVGRWLGDAAFSDEGVVERTHFLGVDGTAWSVVSDVHGAVAGDDKYVYSGTLGPDRTGPVQVLALDRSTVSVAWQTQLEVKAPEGGSIAIAVRDGLLAVQVGPKIYVLEVAK